MAIRSALFLLLYSLVFLRYLSNLDPVHSNPPSDAPVGMGAGSVASGRVLPALPIEAQPRPEEDELARAIRVGARTLCVACCVLHVLHASLMALWSAWCFTHP